jgi:phosphorylase kinase alpha/beta subunit
LLELAAIIDKNPDIKIADYIVLDILIGHAVRIAWLDRHPEHTDRYDDFKTAAWSSFYKSSTYECAASVAQALRFLTQLGQSMAEQMEAETAAAMAEPEVVESV